MKKLHSKEIAEHKNDRVREIADELDTFKALRLVAESEGGLVLRNSLMKDVVDVLDTLSAKFKTLSQQEFVSLCASLKEKTDMLRALTLSKKNAEALEIALKDALNSDE